MSNYYGLAGGSVPGIGTTGNQLGPSQVPTDLKPGDSAWAFGKLVGAGAGGNSDATVLGEQPAVPQASIPISVGPATSGGTPMITVEVAFYATGTLVPAAPGTFEVDIQEADTDCDAAYIMPTGSSAYKINALASGSVNRARADFSPSGGRFMRALLVSRANGVDVVVKFTRMT